MKNLVSLNCCLLLTSISLLPVGTLISYCLGYNFKLTNYPLFAVLILVFSLIALILYLFTDKYIQNNFISISFCILLPLLLIDIFIYIFECDDIRAFLPLFVSLICCSLLTIKCGKPFALKIITVIISVLLILPIGFFGIISLIFGGIAKNTVVYTVNSPNGSHYAEVVDSDQGALGGDTFVYVYENKGINLILLKVYKEPKRIYEGDWGAYKNMDIYWKSEDCLVIGSDEFDISED